MVKEKEKSRWSRVRGLFHTVHLWLGVGSALILFAVCLSGTVYTFSSEIQKMTDSELYYVSAPANAQRLPTETLIAQLLDSVKGGVVQSVIVPEAIDGSYQIVVGQANKDNKPGEKKEERKKDDRETKSKEKKGGEAKAAAPRPRGTTYFVNPYTGDVLGKGETSSYAFFQFMFRLHRWLLLDQEIGRPIVGVATLIFVVIIISGWVIWFPKKIKNWRQGLKVKTSANWKRINHDLHNSLGLYASLFLFVMALTGLTWSFEWYKTGFNNALGVEKRQPSSIQSEVTDGAVRPSIEVYLSAADQVLPYPGDYRITLPADSSATVSLMKTKNSFFATSVADRVTLDQYSAKVLNKELFSEKPFNEQVSASIKAIHVGSFYGTFSKIIYLITCLIGTSLPVTGVMIWINKLRKKKGKKASKGSVQHEEVELETVS